MAAPQGIKPNVPKQQMLDTVAALPDDADFDDAIDALHLLYKIERGLAEAQAGLTISHEEARGRMAKWLA